MPHTMCVLGQYCVIDDVIHTHKFTELGLQYSEGAFGGACEWPLRRLEMFPKDHLRDIMESFATYPSGGLPEVHPFPLGKN